MSGDNETERTNNAISEALGKGHTIHACYYAPFDGLESNEIDALDILEYEERLNKCVEKNVWTACFELSLIIDDEPGPSKSSFLKFTVTSSKQKYPFTDKDYLTEFYPKSEIQRIIFPKHAYYNKLKCFIDKHFEIGELYLEYLKGDCKRKFLRFVEKQ